LDLPGWAVAVAGAGTEPERLIELIQIYKENPELLKRWWIE
jgi:hypothetical protein